jgi:hypothetical protein
MQTANMRELAGIPIFPVVGDHASMSTNPEGGCDVWKTISVV